MSKSLIWIVVRLLVYSGITVPPLPELLCKNHYIYVDGQLQEKGVMGSSFLQRVCWMWMVVGSLYTPEGFVHLKVIFVLGGLVEGLQWLDHLARLLPCSCLSWNCICAVSWNVLSLCCILHIKKKTSNRWRASYLQCAWKTYKIGNSMTDYSILSKVSLSL